MKKHADGKKSRTTDKNATPLWQSTLLDKPHSAGLKVTTLTALGWQQLRISVAECLWVFSNLYETGYCFQAFLVAHCSHHRFTLLTCLPTLAERAICGGIKPDHLIQPRGWFSRPLYKGSMVNFLWQSISSDIIHSGWEAVNPSTVMSNVFV